MDTPQSEVNALFLYCDISERKYKRSFATVLQMDPATDTRQEFDVAITTGHGLLGNDGNPLTGCVVRYPGSKIYPVRAIKLAPNYKPGTPTDWAVLILPKIKHENLVRYAVGRKLSRQSIDDLAEKRPSILFSTARGLPINGQNCIMEPRRFAGLQHRNFIGFLSHTCKAISGQSGSPISVVRNGQRIVLGIHVGNSGVFGYPSPHTPLHYRGYMRGIDDKFMIEFSKILTDLNTELIQKRKR